MASDSITYRREGSIGYLSLNRPEKLNAMTEEMGEALRTLVLRLNEEPELRCVIVRGEGRAFSAGGDLAFLEENAGRTRTENQDTMRDFYAKYLEIMEIEVPTIAVLQGRATGAGLCLALGCDMRFAADDAVLSMNFVRVGLSPGMGGTWNLPRLIGPGCAAELLYTGRNVTAAEAQAMGLVNGVFPAGQLLEQVVAIAAQIAEGAPGALRLTKKLLRDSASRSLSDGLSAEAAAQAECFASQDLLEGVAAVREKRAPRFQGA